MLTYKASSVHFRGRERKRKPPKASKPVSLPVVAFVEKTNDPFPPRPAPQAVSSRAERILGYIDDCSGFTVLEYSDLLTEPTTMISAILVHTDLGRWLASTGKVALPSLAARPDWLKKVPNELRQFVPIKTPVAQLKLPPMPKEKGLDTSDWSMFGQDIVNILCRNTTSPKVRLKRLQAMADHLAKSMTREIEAQKKIAILQITAPAPVVPMLAAPIVKPKRVRVRKAPVAAMPIVEPVVAVAKKPSARKPTAKSPVSTRPVTVRVRKPRAKKVA